MLYFTILNCTTKYYAKKYRTIVWYDSYLFYTTHSVWLIWWIIEILQKFSNVFTSLVISSVHWILIAYYFAYSLLPSPVSIPLSLYPIFSLSFSLTVQEINKGREEYNMVAAFPSHPPPSSDTISNVFTDRNRWEERRREERRREERRGKERGREEGRWDRMRGDERRWRRSDEWVKGVRREYIGDWREGP
jgi:hypothetical protein